MALCVPKFETYFESSLAPVIRADLYFVSSNIVCSGPGSSVGVATTGSTVRDQNPGGDEIFRPSRPAGGPPSPLYNGNRVFPGDRGGRGVGLTSHPIQNAEHLEKSRAIPLLTLRDCVDYKKVTTYRHRETGGKETTGET